MPSKRLAKAGLSREAFDRRVKAIKRSGGAENAYAAATAAFNREKGLKPLRKTKKREMRGKR